MQNVDRRKEWFIILCGTALTALYMTVPASAIDCTKPNNAYSDVIIATMAAARKDQSLSQVCAEYKKALPAATALKELSMRTECYHTKAGLAGMAALVKSETDQETRVRTQMQQICEAAGCVEESGDTVDACSRAINVDLYTGLARAELFNRRGADYRAKGDYDLAIADFTQAIRLSADYAGAYAGRCLAHLNKGENEQALADCNEAIQLDPKYAVAYNNREFYFLKLGQVDSAIADYDNSLKLDPKLVTSLFGRGLAELRKGDSAAGDADIAAAKAIRDDIADVFVKNGVNTEYAKPSGTPNVPEPGRLQNAPTAVSQPVPSGPVADCARAETHWKSAEQIGTLEVYQDHLARFPNCEFATLAGARIEALKKK